MSSRELKSRKKWYVVLVFLVFSFSLATKLKGLGEFSFDYDEIYSIRMAEGSYGDLLTAQRYDPGNPPLYFIMLKGWLSLLGEGEFQARLLSVVFYMIGMVAIYLGVKKDLKPETILIVLVLYATSILIFAHARYARAYSLILCLSVVVFFKMVDFLKKKDFNLRSAGWLLLLCLVGVYAHYSFVVFYVFLFLVFLWELRRSKHRLERLLVFTCFVVGGYLPWIIFFIKAQVSPIMWWHKYKFGQVGKQWIGFEGWLKVLSNQVFESWRVEFQRLLVIWIILIFAVVLIYIYKREKRLWARSAIVFYLVYFNVLLFTPVHLVFSDPRYSIFIFPFLFLCLGVLLDKVVPSIFKNLVLVVLIVCGVVTSKNYQNGLWENWKNMALDLPIYEEDSVILFHPCYLAFSLDYYYKGVLPMYCFIENTEGMYLNTWVKEPKEKLYVVIKKDEEWRIDLLMELKEECGVEEKLFGNIKMVYLKGCVY